MVMPQFPYPHREGTDKILVHAVLMRMIRRVELAHTAEPTVFSNVVVFVVARWGHEINTGKLREHGPFR